ncbi:MAG: biotin-dependent carboxyltransferase family protein [Beijerinckiaceae bacterium]
MIDILAPAGNATVQDAGRFGHRHVGIGSNGAMDALALKTANVMLGNHLNCAAIEVPGVPMRLRFLADTAFAITGADAGVTLAGRPIPRNWRDCARAGDELVLGHARHGVYSYIAVAGGIDVPLVLGSRATHVRGIFGGFKGRILQPGDQLPVGKSDAAQASFGVGPPEKALPLNGSDDATLVRVLPAAEYDAFHADAQHAFWTTAWRISSQSNRAGYRLMGPVLDLAESLEMRSHGLVPGVIQGPAGGQPIIQLADAYTAGGYPKIGVVIEPDLWRIAQTPLGNALRFQRCTYAEALAAHDALAAHLDRIRTWMATCELGTAA